MSPRIEISLWHAFIGLAIGVGLSSSGGEPEPKMLLWGLGACTFGAWIGGLLFAGAYGKPGYFGWGEALVAALLSVAVGGAVGGTCIVPVIGTVLGPIFLFQLSFESPLAALAVLLAFATIHLRARSIRGRVPA
ncbi:MAG: hypothetical protein AAF714_09975 [Pseudomonadota bacterium]